MAEGSKKHSEQNSPPLI